MSFEEALNFLNSRRNFEVSRNFGAVDFGGRLVRLREFVNYLGCPDKKYKIVHVAGTKGKGSTCVFLEGILLGAGAVVGRFTSPHLYSFLERVIVNGIPCGESEFAETMLYIRDKMELFDLRLSEEITFFELLTVFSFEYFARRSVDFVLFEVGLGGRFDATNICYPAITVIANLSFDHIEQLGPTLCDIAREKGGIIKSGVPLISSVCDVGAREVLCGIVESCGAPVYFEGESFVVEPVSVAGQFEFKTVEDKFPVRAEFGELNVRMAGKHQRHNASLAIAAALLLQDEFVFDNETIRNGLAKGFLPARVEIFQDRLDEPVFVVDGAHNRASAEVFVEALRGLFPARRKFLVFGTTMGKDVEGMLVELLPNFRTVFMTQYSSNPRFFPPIGLRTIAEAILPTLKLGRDECSMSVVDDCSVALDKCFELAGKNDIICVTGSLFLAAELREYYLNRIKANKK
ncbi:MAG: hypothetical protein LBT09_12995 [Planctomycetaceae bacterium]|jgi:dihydrofolate synthase/folylpolyglutamate synthase|nr:hypothetical protein [Planctomycetaceae bacterium]